MAVTITGNTRVIGQTTVGVVNPPLLDVYSGATAGYSVSRKLRTAWTGFAIRVRRSSDNTTQDIGFDTNGNLDESALSTFVGAGNGFINILYDQTGSANSITQSTTTLQPQIVSSGIINKLNGKPCMKFDGVNDYMQQTTSAYNRQNFSVSIVWNYYNTTGTQFIYSIELDPNRNYPAILVNPNLYYGIGASATSINLGAANLNQFLFFGASSGSNVYGYRNGTQYGPFAISSGTSTLVNTIGAYGTTGTYTSFGSVNVQEIVFWNTSQFSNANAIQQNINAYYNIY